MNITMKFGGTSVGSPDAINNVHQIVAEEIAKGNTVAVVVSAMSGVTDMLLNSVRSAVAGDKWGYMQLNEEIRDKHLNAIHELMPAGHHRESIIATVREMLKKHIELCEAINILGEATPRIIDSIVSYGERLSARMVAAVLKDRGIDSKAFDAGEFVITNDDYQDAEPIWEQTENRIVERLKPVIADGLTPVITGFIGATPDGSITTLGRGGSDFSAAIFAAYLDSDELIIWTDVDGVMTTDPRLDKRAKVLPYISYAEVGELAFYGAKVLHPKTVQPIINKEIPLRVRNTFNANHPGTLIGPKMEETKLYVRAVTAVRKVSMLTVSGKGMLGVPGIAGRTFLATAKAGASILMISQSSSEQSFCFTVVDSKADMVKKTVEEELSIEIYRQDVDSVDVVGGIVIVTVVGAGMRHRPGVAGKVFSLMGENNVNVLAIAQGSSECSISFVISEQDLQTAVYKLHELALEEE
jgi:bifunctional aspartokinase / homoserine dehydrogenase 1